MNRDIIRKMTRTAAWSLGCSVFIALAVILFYYISDYRFTISATAAKYMFFGAVILAVLVVAMALLTIRKRPRQIRQIDDITTRLTEYASMVKSIFRTTLSTSIILSAVILLTGNNTLLMFVIIIVLLQIMSFPNMYKVKVDAGLTHEEMHAIFGDDYKE